MLESKKILITGAAGSIGSELVRQLIEKNDIYILDSNETAFFNLYEELQLKGYKIHGAVGDVRQWGALQHILSWGNPSFIFHAAALKHVTPSAWSPEEYITTNINGTLNMIRFAEKHHSRLVNISTDKVVNPNSIMAATKKVAEIAVRDAGQVSVRFGNVMGSRGSVLEIWQRQADSGEPLTVTDSNAERYMMTIPEAVRLVIKAAETGNNGDIMILDMGTRVNILRFAIEILKKAGKKPPFEDKDVKFIGLRPGETTVETLMTDEEQKRAKKEGEFFIIEREKHDARI